MSNRSIEIRSVDDVNLLASILFEGMRPSWCGRKAELAAVIMAGHSLGIGPVQAVNNIMIMGGRAVIWGDLALALVRSSKLLEEIEETIVGKDMDRKAICKVKRQGMKPRVEEYSMADAQKAGLLDEKRHRKTGPWWTNPDRQLKMRARGFALRDEFGDVLCGLSFVEEANDHIETEAVQVGQSAAPEPQPAKESQLALNPPKTNREKLIEKLGEARAPWFRSLGVDGDTEKQKAKWVELLQERYKTDTIKNLTDEQVEELLKHLQSIQFAQENKELFGNAQQ